MAWYVWLGVAAGLVGIAWAIDMWLLPEPKIRPCILRLFKRGRKGPGTSPTPSLSPKLSGGGGSNETLLLQIPSPNPRSGRVDIRLTIEYLDGLPNAKPEIKDPFEEGLKHKKKYEYDEAIKLFRQALAQGATGSQKAALLSLIGNCFAEQSKFSEAERHYREAGSAAKEVGDQEAIAHTYNNIGHIYQCRGDYDKALEWFIKALNVNQTRNEGVLATTYNNIGFIHYSRGHFNKALGWFEKSMKITKLIGDQAVLAATYNNIGAVHDSRSDYDKALEWYQKSMKMRE